MCSHVGTDVKVVFYRYDVLLSSRALCRFLLWLVILPTLLTIECEKSSVVKHTKTEVPQAETRWDGREVCAQDLANALANNPLSRLSGP